MWAALAGASGMAQVVCCLGLGHDFGKLRDRRQRYVLDNEGGRAPRGGPDHKAFRNRTEISLRRLQTFFEKGEDVPGVLATEMEPCGAECMT